MVIDLGPLYMYISWPIVEGFYIASYGEGGGKLVVFWKNVMWIDEIAVRVLRNFADIVVAPSRPRVDHGTMVKI